LAKLIYDKNGRLIFTKEMKKEYTILMPMMLPIHFELLQKCLTLEGYKVELLKTNHRGIVDEGLKNVHNDTCYPALLVIGQLLDALKSGKYDLDKTALIITQTGGGCRASNYIHLLRKALKKSGFEKIPVISINLSGLEKNPGFKLDFKLIKKLIYCVLYGDLIMLLANQCRPYEINNGQTDNLVENWTNKLIEQFNDKKFLKYKSVLKNFEIILEDFDNIKILKTDKIKVGVVGEIYIKYAPLGNNSLEKFLASEGAEVVVPGVLDFLIFKVDNRVTDCKLYGRNLFKEKFIGYLQGLLEKSQRAMINTIMQYPKFRAPEPFSHIKQLVVGYLGHGNKMGEGWLLTGEMLELVSSGVKNVVCTQPFGCLPNHIVGKGMIRKIMENMPGANIVAIDYDPGATQINQENRIKLMLANAYLTKENELYENDKKEQEKVLLKV